MKNIFFKSVSVFAMLAFCATSAIAQVTVTETIEHGGTVTTKKVITETETVPVIVAPTTVETVTTTRTVPVETLVESRANAITAPVVALPGTRLYTILDFDVNHDSILSLNDVGIKLFDIYDTDGNDIIDNIEFERRAVLTVAPAEVKTTVRYDFDGDGLADQVETTREIFQQRTGLSAFDRNGDGLSAREFTGRHFNEADINNDHAVDLKEWQGCYIAYVDQQNKLHAGLNK